MKPRGIPIAQIESNTEGDPKFTVLRILAGDGYYSAFGSYMSIVLRAWATASREVDPDLERLMDPDDIAVLAQAGLLDAQHRIPEPVFEKFVGTVLEGRRRDAERKRPSPPDSAGLRRTPRDSKVPSSPLLSSAVLSSTEEGVQGEEPPDDPAFDTYCKFVNVASLNASKWIDDLVAQFGEKQTADAIATAGLGGPSKLLERAKAALVKGARAADRAEAAEEKARLAEKRAPVNAIQTEYRAAIAEKYGEDRR